MNKTRGLYTVEQIVRLRQRNVPIRKIAAINGTGTGSIYAILRRHGHKIGQIGKHKRGDRIKGHLTREQIIRLYSVTKTSPSKIAKADGTSVVIINRILRKARVAVWPQSIFTKSSYDAQARDLNVSVDTFRRFLAMSKLGMSCVKCGEDDPRLLQLNHLTDKCGALRIHEFLSIIQNGSTTHDVRCANCNILYEYERGRRRHIPMDIMHKIKQTNA